jgi:hypothetical protein
MSAAIQEEEGPRWMVPVFWLLGVSNLASGLWMPLAPEDWFHNFPAAIPDTGPFNHHFVQDIGSAFLTIGVASWSLRRGRSPGEVWCSAPPCSTRSIPSSTWPTS